MHSALALQIAHGFADFTAGELLHCFLERRIFLPDDLVKMRWPHSGFLQLMVRSPCFDCFMLANVAYEQHTVFSLQTPQELIYLACAGETRFIQHIQVFSFAL